MDNTTTHTHETGTGMNTLLTIIFLSIGWISHFVQNVSYGDVYNFIFRALSLLAVLFTIIMNWPKVKEGLFKKRKKK